MHVPRSFLERGLAVGCVLTATGLSFSGYSLFGWNQLGFALALRDHSFDIVMFVDVLHHTFDRMILLREAVRVACIGIVIKDHWVRGLLARARLRFIDYVGKARFGVALPYNYWTETQRRSAQQELGLKPKLLLRNLSFTRFLRTSSLKYSCISWQDSKQPDYLASTFGRDQDRVVISVAL